MLTKTNPLTYRFFYHYFKNKKAMSVHFKETCFVVKDVVCHVPCETKWKKSQPRLVMQGYAIEVVVENEKAYIF